MLTVDEARTLLQIPPAADQALLAELVALASGFASEYLGRDLAPGVHPESHDGGGRYLFLAHYPASAVTVAGVDPADYRLHGDRGVVEAVNRRFPAGELAVTVTVAPGAVPDGVRRAVAELVGHWYREAKTHAATGHVNHGVTNLDGQYRSYPWGQSNGYRVPPAVVDALKRARGVTV